VFDEEIEFVRKSTHSERTQIYQGWISKRATQNYYHPIIVRIKFRRQYLYMPINNRQ